MSFAQRALPLAVLALGALACSATTRTRDITYGPDFRYIPKTEVTSTMSKLASEVVVIDEILRREGPRTEAERTEIVARLETMETLARALTAPGARTNHPKLDEHLDRFRTDIVRAREAAAVDPPSYFLAGSIAGSCLYCHGEP